MAGENLGNQEVSRRIKHVVKRFAIEDAAMVGFVVA
jgi:hypothetical protein